MVKENPKQAYQLYIEREDPELGRIFANNYKGHPEYGVQAYHIANELGMTGIQEPLNHVRAEVADLERRIFGRM